MKIGLSELRLKNFKGVLAYSLRPDGNSIDVLGDNETGKTTLLDGFLWLLFNKDSQGKSLFEVKTLAPDGSPIHNLDHEVSAIFDVDGNPLALRKVMAEDWTKKRGSASAEFTGHKTAYFVDDVPVSESQYKAKVAETITEDVFRLLTDPRYFPSLHWEKQRATLLSICGEISDAEVVELSGIEDLAKLAGILGGHTVDEQRKIIAARRKKINDELQQIPARIDELNSIIPAPADLGEINHDLANTTQERIFLEQDRQNSENDGGMAALKSQLADKKASLRVMEEDIRKKTGARIAGVQAEINKRTAALEDLKRVVERIERKAKADSRDIEVAENSIEKLKAQWYAEDETVFCFEDTLSCPTCKQPLPEDQVAAARATALEAFNQVKGDVLANINNSGKRLKASVEAYQKDLESAKGDWVIAIESGIEIENEIASLKADLAIMEAEPVPAGITAAQGEIEDLEKKIAAGVSDKSGTEKLDAEIKERIDRERELRAELTRQEQRIKFMDRIKELEASEKALAAEYEALEAALHLIDLFTVAKVNVLEERINSRFAITKWKLFDKQINGGIVETCVATHKGVPYPSLNNAARINVGMDIINILSEYYGVTAPIWIDNAESVVSLQKTGGQVIRLMVSADHPSLTVRQAGR